MDLNLILELLRESMMDIDNIKNAVKGHIYSSWIDNNSELPCITIYFMRGVSPANINGAIEAIVQVRVWTDNATAPYAKLYGIYEDILDNFHQKRKENSYLKMSTNIGGFASEHPNVMIEKVGNQTLYSLPVKTKCRAIFN